ncbi:46149_t:CDS:2, partial [Gigaspora margarita]
MDDIEINMSNMDVLTQTSIECPMEEGSQTNTVTQQDSSGVLSIPEYMRGNKNLQDGLDTLSPMSDVTVQSNRHLDLHLSETVMEPTKSDETGWLQSEGFTPVVSKKLAVSRKSTLINKSMSQELENRKSPYGKKGR